jgi:hypothetical protein
MIHLMHLFYLFYKKDKDSLTFIKKDFEDAHRSHRWIHCNRIFGTDYSSNPIVHLGGDSRTCDLGYLWILPSERIEICIFPNN